MRRTVLVLLAAIGLLCGQIQANPYSGTPAAIPGKIDAENFDLGGEGVGYHDNEAANLGGAYRTAEGVDIGDCFDAGQGYSIGWTRAGEWMQYTVSIAATGTYQIDVRYATPSCGGAIHFELDGNAITPSLALNTTGGWQTWQTASFSANLTASSSAALRVVMDSTGISGSVANLNYFNIYTPGSTPALPTSPYALLKEYSGSTFFDDFNFFTAADPTHGYVTYVDRATATNAGLAKLTSAGQVYMAVDNTSIASGVGRRSVRIESTAAYNGGLFVLDVEHMPTGCGTWPAFWLNGPNWPAGGEIDIFEGVHTSTATVTVLHTNAGCSQYGADASKITGSWIVRNCYVNAPGQAANQGCGVSGKVGTFGAPFNAGKGGVSATLWDSTGIRVWFFPRGSIPDDLTGGQPQPTSWGLPYARFDFGAECPSWHFSNHHIIFNIALCGDWAGGTFGSSCPNMGSCQSYVQNNPSAFSQAYWLVNTLRVYQLRA